MVASVFFFRKGIIPSLIRQSISPIVSNISEDFGKEAIKFKKLFLYWLNPEFAKCHCLQPGIQRDEAVAWFSSILKELQWYERAWLSLMTKRLVKFLSFLSKYYRFLRFYRSFISIFAVLFDRFDRKKLQKRFFLNKKLYFSSD